MNNSVDQYCIRVTDLDKSVHFYETVCDLKITHRVETDDFREVILQGATGGRIQLAYHYSQKGPIDHGDGFWKLYLQTDDCEALYKRCIEAGAESVMAPERLADWPVTAAFVKDPDGYLVEMLETHGETPEISGPAAR